MRRRTCTSPSVSADDLTPAELRRWTRVGMLAAVALLLSYAETFVPIPVPGVKLGLANIAVLLALSRGDIVAARYVALIKVFATGLLFGTPLTIVFSLAGTSLSFLGMAALSRMRTMRLWMVSVAGAFLHQIGQLMVATLVIGPVIWYASPLMLAISCVTGALCGILAEQVATALPPDDELSADAPCVLCPHKGQPLFSPNVPTTGMILFMGACLGVFTVVVLRLVDPLPLAICAGVLVLVCALVGVRARALSRVLLLTLTTGCLTLALHLIYSPQIAWEETLVTALRLFDIAIASLVFARLIPTEDLTQTVSTIARPLERFGLDTRGFVIAFRMAVQLVPMLSDVVHEQLATKGVRLGLAGLKKALPGLVHEFYRRAGLIADAHKADFGTR